MDTVKEAMEFKRLNINYFSCIPPYNQEGAQVALEHPESEKWMAEMTAAFERRARAVVQDLNRLDGVCCDMPKGAFYAFPEITDLCRNLGVAEAHNRLPETIRRRNSVSGLFQMFALYHHGVAVLDRSSFGTIGTDDSHRHFIRLSLASSREDLAQGVARLAAAGNNRDGFKTFVEKDIHHL